MEPRDVEADLRKLVAENLDVELDSVDLDAAVEEVANSLELSALFYAVEKHFDVVFADSDIGRLRVFRDLVTLVREARS